MEDTLGLRIRLARTRQGLSQKTLAQHVGITPTALSHIEHDHAEPTVTHLCAIARVLRVSLDGLCAHEASRETC